MCEIPNISGQVVAKESSGEGLFLLGYSTFHVTRAKATIVRIVHLVASVRKRVFPLKKPSSLYTTTINWLVLPENRNRGRLSTDHVVICCICGCSPPRCRCRDCLCLCRQILTSARLRRLVEAVPPGLAMKTWRLGYSIARDGASLWTLLQNCRGRGP